jgi:hypothetical protein
MVSPVALWAGGFALLWLVQASATAWLARRVGCRLSARRVVHGATGAALVALVGRREWATQSRRPGSSDYVLVELAWSALRVVVLLGVEDAVIHWSYRAWSVVGARQLCDPDGSSCVVVLELVSAVPSAARPVARRASQEHEAAFVKSVISVLGLCVPFRAVRGAPAELLAWLCLRVLESLDAFVWEAQAGASRDLAHSAWRPGFAVPLVASSLHRSALNTLLTLCAVSTLGSYGGGTGLSEMVWTLLAALNVLAAIADHRRLPDSVGFGAALALLVAVRVGPLLAAGAEGVVFPAAAAAAAAAVAAAAAAW